MKNRTAIANYLNEQLIRVNEAIMKLQDEKEGLLRMIKVCEGGAYSAPLLPMEDKAMEVKSKSDLPQSHASKYSREYKEMKVQETIAIIESEGLSVDAASKRCGLNSFAPFYQWKKELGIEWSPRNGKTKAVPEQSIVVEKNIAKKPGRVPKTEEEKLAIVQAVAKVSVEDRCNIARACRKVGVDAQTYYLYKKSLGIVGDARVADLSGKTATDDSQEGKAASDEVVEVDMMVKRKMLSDDDDYASSGRKPKFWNEKEKGVEYLDI